MAKYALINGCIKVEKSAASMYKKLMKKFPDKKDFWNELFDDEVSHLSFLNDVKSLGLIDEVQKKESLPSMEIINRTLKLAGDLSDKIRSEAITFRKALSMAVKFEESVVEAYTNKIIADLISCDDKPSYKKMIADEKKHVNKIKKMMK